MIQVFSASWALFLGMFLLMIGNGLQGTLLGLRGEMEGFSTFELSVVMSAYFVGFLGGSAYTPKLIARVGHVRVFAALGSMVSAILILYPALAEPWAWVIGRVIIGFCFCGVYITAESWLNDASDNAHRGQALSIYLIVQMAGIVFAQYLVTVADIGGYVLFIISSVVVSLAFAPVLLSAGKSPDFSATKRMKVKDLIAASPLACVGMFLVGGIFAAQFGMSAVYGQRVGLTVQQISFFISTIYISALVLQFPIGWLSDRIDRRILIIGLGVVGGGSALVAYVSGGAYWAILVSGAVVGGTSNPMYALLIAYVNDYLDREDMAAASGGLLMVNGLGAIGGPIILGYMMDGFGPGGYWLFVSVVMFAIGVYAAYRMTRRDRSAEEFESVPYQPIPATSTTVLAEVAQEVYIEAEEEVLAEAPEDAEDADGSPELAQETTDK